MKESKFRAWDKIDNEFAQNIDCLLDMSVAERVFALDDEGGELIIEQYTGLKDKNGKEIYEGDIVVNTYYDDGEMYKVLWVDDSVAFGMESLDDMELYKLPLESLEVIGNIHENPELLQEGK